MAKIVVELDAYVIPDEHQVFKFSPGKTYRFYKIVRDAKVAFPDIRGLETLQGDPDNWDDKEILKVITDDRWTRELESRARGNQPKGSAKTSPQDRKRLTFLKRLFFEAKKGDLLVVPVDAYTKDVLIGEVQTNPGNVRTVVAKDGDGQYSYMGRPVRWLARVEKRRLSGALLDALHSQTAIFTLGKSLRHEIYRLAYGDFVYDGLFVASFRTSKARFTSEDSAVVSTWFNGLDVLRNAMANGDVNGLPASFAAIGLEKLADGQAAELQINVNSPGSFLVRTAEPFAFGLMAMFALSGCDSQQIIDEGVTIQMKTVGGDAADCEHQIEESVNAMATALGPQRLEEECELAKRANQDAEISTSASLQNRQGRRN